jgi:hypothetical protein
MSRRIGLWLRTGFAACSAAALCACAARPPPPPAVAHTSYEWHGLLLVPFGTLLKDSPLALHEVLLFHDAARSGSGDEDGDCYGIDAPPPQFAGRRPEDYRLCFEHDRLSRIEATVQLPADDASRVFAQACAEWRGESAPGAPGAPDAQGADRCDGRAGATGFRASLEPGPAAAPATALPMSTLSISLFSADAEETP